MEEEREVEIEEEKPVKDRRKSVKEIKKEELVIDYIDIARELTGMVRENWLMGFQLGLSIWEESLKITSNQIEQWVSVQEEYTTLMKEISTRFPTEIVNFWGISSKIVSAPVEKILSVQKDYSSALINISDRSMKEAFMLMRNGIERAFSSFNDYINLIKG